MRKTLVDLKSRGEISCPLEEETTSTAPNAEETSMPSESSETTGSDSMTNI